MKKTLVLKVSPHNPEPEKIRVAAEIIKKGGLVAFPTETVYGLGADALNSKAVLKLFKAKNRPLDNPPIVHVGYIKDVYSLVRDVPKKAEKLMKNFWPGPLTLIFKRSEVVPEVTTAGLDTVAIRMPNHKVALALLRESKKPIAAPSANLAGKPSPTTAEHVLADLDGRIDAVLDGGQTNIGVESTVLDLTVDPPQVLRPGGTPYEVLREVLMEVELHPVVFADKKISIEKARSPGLKHRHYAPEAELIVVEGGLSAVVEKINELVESYRRRKMKVGVLATNQTVDCYRADVVKSLGERDDLKDVAKNLFKLLREFDFEGVDVIIAEGVSTRGLGLAVMNRLRKASGYNIVRAS
ncbi:threonylcarbamoyl-AMP synthase [Candidatus Bathyarchaeota archaeon]|nr:threonylcarbamoyl-AMP synthase [Candidatus Bathyarchaeota archaeon]